MRELLGLAGTSSPAELSNCYPGGGRNDPGCHLGSDEAPFQAPI